MVADHEVNPAVICMKIYTHDGTCVKNAVTHIKQPLLQR